jgi:hypothetical protein
MLKLIDKFGATDSFSPEDVLILVAAFDEAWARIEQSGARFGSDMQRELARNTLGKYIIEEARKGQADKAHLRDGALLHYAQLRKR